jgi:uridine kinase
MISSIESVDELQSRILKAMGALGKFVIGIDGMDGAGKSSLAHDLGARLGAKVVSVDDFWVDRELPYVAHIACQKLEEEMLSSSVAIVEGVCLRAVAERCGIAIDFHVYVRVLSHPFRFWHDQEVCLSEFPVEELKRQAQGLRDVVGAGELRLEGDLIDYHAENHPVRGADVVFDRIEEA